MICLIKRLIECHGSSISAIFVETGAVLYWGAGEGTPSPATSYREHLLTPRGCSKGRHVLANTCRPDLHILVGCQTDKGYILELTFIQHSRFLKFIITPKYLNFILKSLYRTLCDIYAFIYIYIYYVFSITRSVMYDCYYYF